jgi:hypothetical protein
MTDDLPTSEETISDSQFRGSGATLRTLSCSAWAWGSGAYSRLRSGLSQDALSAGPIFAPPKPARDRPVVPLIGGGRNAVGKITPGAASPTALPSSGPPWPHWRGSIGVMPVRPRMSSSTLAAQRMRASLRGGPAICSPTGRPSAVKPHGSDSAGQHTIVIA